MQLLSWPNFCTYPCLILGFIGSLFSLLQFIASPFIGAASDVYGRRPMMLITMVRYPNKIYINSKWPTSCLLKVFANVQLKPLGPYISKWSSMKYLPNSHEELDLVWVFLTVDIWIRESIYIWAHIYLGWSIVRFSIYESWALCGNRM